MKREISANSKAKEYLLHEKIRDWNAWRKSLPENVHIKLYDLNLAAYCLTGVNLSDMIICNTTFAKTNLTGADFHGTSARKCVFDRANLGKAIMYSAMLAHCSFKKAQFSNTDMRYAMMAEADLSYTFLSHTRFSHASLRNANLKGAWFNHVDLGSADLSGAKGLLNPSDWLAANFELTNRGIIAYKVFDVFRTPPDDWIIEKGATITEEVNMTRTVLCGSGVNVASLKWLMRYLTYSELQHIWRVLIPWRDNIGQICVPYNTEGKFRCHHVELLEREYV